MAKRPRNRAFSFIELLTVLSILAVLAALLLPAFAEARRDAAKTPCAENLRQIGHCFALYAADWDDYYPTAINPWDRQNAELMTEFPRPWGTIPSITEALAPYATAYALWRCPLDRSSFEQYGTSYDFADRQFFGKPMSRFNASAFKVAHDIGGWHSGTFEWADHDHIEWRENELFGDDHVAYGYARIFVTRP